MFSSPTPAPGSRAIASSALRSAGLIDRDAPMRDLTDNPGGRKGSSKIRGHRPREIDAFKDTRRVLPGRPSSSHAGPSDILSIRGASRPNPMGRVRRGAVSSIAGGGPTVRVTVNKPNRVKVVEIWKELVKKRWNPESRFLNLESMNDDELVKKHSLSPPGHGGDHRDAAVIFKIAGQLTPKVETLSLANNNLNGQHLQYLAHYLPRLANLSLQGNKIRLWKDLDFISSRKGKLLHLRELVLLDNPIRELNFKDDNGQRYKQEMGQRFSSLEVLDQEAITQISFDLPVSSTTAEPDKKPDSKTFPCDMRPSFVTGVDGSIVSSFLIRFFGALDTQRPLLINAYDPAATFSFSANTTIATRARLQGFHNSMPNQTKLNWKPWISNGSRNLTRINGGFDRTVKSLHIGAEDAVKALMELPRTKHDIGGPPEKFCLDSFPVVHGQGMGLLLTVHGQFTEVGTEGIRSFDRSFILTPAPEGSRAKLNGWDVVILSDQWTIRGYSSHEAWKPGPMLVQALSRHQQQAQDIAAVQAATPPSSQPQSQPQPLPFDPQAALSTMPEPQRNLVMQVCQSTGLNVQFAIDCLGGNSWDLEKAIVNFNQVKATLSREAFM